MSGKKPLIVRNGVALSVVAAGAAAVIVISDVHADSSAGATAPAPPVAVAATGDNSSSEARTAHPRSRPPAPLPAAMLPNGAAALWKAIGRANVRDVDHDVHLNECATVHGAAVWQQQGYISTFQTPAVEDSFTFVTTAAATTAYHSLLTTMATCQNRSGTLQTQARQPADAQVRLTATTAGGAAYSRRWTAVAGMSAPGPQTNHIYLVQGGNTLTALQVTEMPGTARVNAYSTAGDQAALAVLTR